MSVLKKLNLVGSLLLALSCAYAAEQDPLARLDEALKALAAYEYGKDPGPASVVEQIVFASVTDPLKRAAVEDRLAQLLKGTATRDAKEIICRQLFTIGTARSVPQLEALLPDPSLSHVARFALGRNEDPAAAEALIRALKKTSGPLQAGILNTLGDCGYHKAVPHIRKLLRASDPVVAQAAAVALGKLGGSSAMHALQSASRNAQEPARRKVDEALLACADQSLAQGKNTDAEVIYNVFYAPNQPKNIRIAALRGLLAAGSRNCLLALAESIRSTDPDFSAAAISVSSIATGTETTKALAGLFPYCDSGKQELLLKALAARHDPAALETVSAATQNAYELVRAAAYETLGTLGDASTVNLLLRAAAVEKGRALHAVRSSLVKLSDGDVNSALLQGLNSADQRIQAQAIRSLAARQATVAVESLLRLASGPDGDLRIEAIRALGKLVDEARLGALAGLTSKLKQPSDLSAAEQAVEAAFLRITDPQKQAAALLSTCDGALEEARPVVLRLLGLTGTPAALARVREALKDETSKVREAAVRTLADWPTPAPVDDLLTIVRTATDPTHKVIALRGFVRLAGLSTNAMAMYTQAMSLAERPEDKKLVLSGLGTAGTPQALALIEPCLTNAQLRTEAALASVQIADRLRQSDAVRAKTVLKSVLAVTTEQPVRQQAQETINKIEEFEGYLLDWMCAGPFQEKDKDAQALFDVVLPPEKPDAGDVKWVKLSKGIGSWDINLSEALGGGDDLAAYLRTRVFSPTNQEVRLELGSDDAVKAWLNGAVVHANNTERGLSPREDIIKAKLKEGWNDVLLKVVNRAGGWACSCRFRQPDGSALDGVKTEAK